MAPTSAPTSARAPARGSAHRPRPAFGPAAGACVDQALCVQAQGSAPAALGGVMSAARISFEYRRYLPPARAMRYKPRRSGSGDMGQAGSALSSTRRPRRSAISSGISDSPRRGDRRGARFRCGIGRGRVAVGRPAALPLPTRACGRMGARNPCPCRPFERRLLVKARTARSRSASMFAMCRRHSPASSGGGERR